MKMKQLADRFASAMVREACFDRPVEVVAYGLEIILNIIVQTGIILIIACILHIFPTVLIAIISAIIFRSFSGGTHCSNFYSCTVLSTTVFISIGYLALKITMGTYFFVTVYTIMLLATTIWAPVNTQKVLKKRTATLLKLSSLTFLMLMFGISTTLQLQKELIAAAVMGLAWQVFSLTPLGIFIISKVDESFQYIRKEVAKDDAKG